MSPIQQQEGWIQRLLQNPYNQDVLREVHAASGDSQTYAHVLEHAASMSAEDTVASYFLTEAALVQLSLLRNSNEALVLFRRALDRDPLNARAAETLTEAYRARNDHAALGSMLKARAEALERLSRRDPDLVPHAADLYETLGVHYAEMPDRMVASVSALRRAIALLRKRDTLSPLPAAEEVHPAESGRRPSRQNVESALVPAPDAQHDSASEEEPTSPKASTAVPGPPTVPDSLRPRRPSVDAELWRSHRPQYSGAPTEAPSEDRLIGLFEALHAVRFCRDVKEASVLVIQIVRDALGAESALLHLFDPLTREYVVTAALGSHHRTVVGIRAPELDPLLQRAAQAAQAVIVSPAAEHELFLAERWEIVEARRSVVCAPVLDEGTPLGAIELVDPKSRGEFDEHDRDAMTYVGGRFAEFMAERGGFVG